MTNKTFITSDETKIIGDWIVEGKVVVGDENCVRIKWLVDNYLQKIKNSPSSGPWEILYKDPIHNRYWEHTYPHSEMHGGGPPALFLLDNDVAQEKYQLGNIRSTSDIVSRLRMFKWLNRWLWHTL